MLDRHNKCVFPAGPPTVVAWSRPADGRAGSFGASSWLFHENENECLEARLPVTGLHLCLPVSEILCDWQYMKQILS